jgi:F0F1-type ATP synthase assembly protein I
MARTRADLAGAFIPGGPVAEREGRSSLAAGLAWASLVTSTALQLVVPPVVGLWVDQRYGTGPWGLLIGAVAGFAAFGSSLWRLMRRLEREAKSAK